MRGSTDRQSKFRGSSRQFRQMVASAPERPRGLKARGSSKRGGNVKTPKRQNLGGGEDPHPGPLPREGEGELEPAIIQGFLASLHPWLRACAPSGRKFCCGSQSRGSASLHPRLRAGAPLGRKTNAEHRTRLLHERGARIRAARGMPSRCGVNGRIRRRPSEREPNLVPAARFARRHSPATQVAIG